MTELVEGLSYRTVGSGPPAVLLHGGGPGCTSALDFGPVLDILAAHRTLILLDLPQYGTSVAPRIEGPLFQFHAAAVARALDRLGVARADFVGQSLGGSVALRLASDNPSRVRRIVLTGSRPTPSDSALGRTVRLAYYGDGGPSQEKMRALLADLEWSDPSLLPECTVAGRFRASITPPALALGVDFAGRGDPEDLGPLLDTVRAPALLLWGAEDQFAAPAYALDIAGRMPRADVAVLSRTAHHPAEERPGDYARLALAFLQ